jgi:hypothetical protein
VGDDLTVVEMRRGKNKSRLDWPFMCPGELINIRTVILRVTQDRLREQLINPMSGSPYSVSAVSLWEQGRRPIPLCVSRHVRGLAEAAREYDERVTG